MPLTRQFREGKRSVDAAAAEIEAAYTDDLTRVFHRTSVAMRERLVAAAEWVRPDADELFDAAKLEDDIDRLLASAKRTLDSSMAAKLAVDTLGDYDTRSVAAAVARRYRDGASLAIMEAWELGESVEQAAERLGGLGKTSGELVARTSLNGMSNATSLAGAQYAEMRLKEWLTAWDDRVRPSHEGIDGEQVPLDAMFSNGCRFPGDPVGPGDETWNCRCTLVYLEESPVLRSSAVTDTVTSMPETTTLATWSSPGIAFLDTLTVDGRALTGEIDWRTPPLPLMSQLEDAHGSMPVMQSRMAGAITRLGFEGNAITAEGTLDDSEIGVATAEALATGRYGVSIDLAVAEWEEAYAASIFGWLTDDQPDEVAEPEPVEDSEAKDAGIAPADAVVEKYSIEDALFVVTKGTIMGATVVPFAAFTDARIPADAIVLVSSADRTVRVIHPAPLVIRYVPTPVSADVLAAVAALEEVVAIDKIPALAAAVTSGLMRPGEARRLLNLPDDVTPPPQPSSDVADLVASLRDTAHGREQALTTLTDAVARLSQGNGSAGRVVFERDESGRIIGARRDN